MPNGNNPQEQPNQNGATLDPAMIQGQNPNGMPAPDPSAMGQPAPAGGNMPPMPPAQGAAPMPGGQPGMMPPPQPSLEDQNGQGTPLIDDVTGSGIDPNTNQPISQNSGNPMESARNTFAQAFANTQNTNPGQPAATAPPAPPQQTAPPMPPAAPPQQPPMIPPAGMNPPATPNAQMPDQNMIRQMAETAVNQAVANGQLPDLTANDIAANANYGMPNVVDAGNAAPNPMEGVNGMTPDTPEGMEVDTVVTNGMPDINSDEFFERFTDNPGQAIMDIANAIAADKIGELTQQIQPLVDESNRVQFRNRVQDAIKNFTANGHEDFPQYREEMVAFLDGSDLPMDDPASYERAYDKAKISSLERMNQELTRTQGRTLADYMSDDDAVGQMSQNDRVRERVINDYLNRLSNGESPQVITDSAGNAPTATEPKRAGTLKDAGKMFLQRMKEG